MTNRPQGSPGAPQLSYSSPNVGMMPRRSSYASVAAGTAAAAGGSQAHNRTSTTTSTRPELTGSYYNPQLSTDHPSRNPQTFVGSESRGNDFEGIAGTLGKGGGRSGISGHYFYSQGYGVPGNTEGTANGFFTPTYLRGSKYIERLEAAYKTRLAAQREAHPSHSAAHGSLSTSSSSVSLYKMAPSHLGKTYDIIEHQPLVDDEGVMPLPARWAEANKNGGLEILGDGLDVRFVGSTKLSEHEGAAARADYPMPPQCGIYFFEVTIVSKGKEEMIGVGFSGSKASLEKLPGWEPDSWAYHGDDGKAFGCERPGKSYGPKFTTGDVIGCGVNFKAGSAFFTKNGVFQGTAFRDLKDVVLYPSVGMRRPQAHLSVNFGQRPFVFDIDEMMARERASIREEITSTNLSRLYPSLDENILIKELVAQFLAHDGYVETARKFAEEVQSEDRALKGGSVTSFDNFPVEEDLDAVNRQQIRAAILDGDIDKALKRTKAYYPQVLQDNSRIYFRLRCRKFVEMIRQSIELLDGTMGRPVKSTNGDSTAGSDDEYEPDMDLDDHANGADDWDRMDTEEADNGLKYQDLLDSAVRYGQELRSEFKDDRSRLVEDAFKDIFSMFAYEDPRKSPTAHLLDRGGRAPVAEELNSAILGKDFSLEVRSGESKSLTAAVSLGKSSAAAIERLYQQAEVLVSDLSEEGGAGAFINVRNDFLR